MGIQAVTNNCDLQILRPRKEGAVSCRPFHMKTQSLKLRNVALPLQNIITVDNRRPGKRTNSGSTGLSPKKNYASAKNFWRNFRRARGQCIRLVFKKCSVIDVKDMLGLNETRWRKTFVFLIKMLDPWEKTSTCSSKIFQKTNCHHLLLLSTKLGTRMIRHFSKYWAIRDFVASDHETKPSVVALFVDQKNQVQMKD